MQLNRTFEECKKDKVGTIYYDNEHYGFRVVVLRGGFSLCAYIGLPHNHPLAGKGYDDIKLNVHGGLTYASSSSESDLLPRERDLYWYGWDYGHYMDKPMYDLPTGHPLKIHPKEHGWAPNEVTEQAIEAAKEMSTLVNGGFTIE